MKEMRVKDFDEFHYPKRRPWLLLILVVVAGFFVFRYYRGRKIERTAEATTAPSEQPSAPEQPRSRPRPPGETLAAKKAAAPSAHVAGIISEAEALYKDGDLVGARARYLSVLKQPISKKVRDDVEQQLGKISAELVLTPHAMQPEKTPYLVRSGDSVERIARQFGTTVDVVSLNNPQIRNPNLIKAGDRLIVFKGKFAIMVGKAQNSLVVSLNGEFFKRYGVGTGKHGRTPVGMFKITQKIEQPVWWRPDGKEVPFGDKENILGTRWMTLRAEGGTPDVRGYGIHGTWDDSSIGKAESAGCIRLANKDVEELFRLVPIGTLVTITE